VHNAKAGGEGVRVLQRSCTLVQTATMIPEVIVKDGITLDGLATASTFVLSTCVVELRHTASHTCCITSGPVTPVGRMRLLWQALLTRPYHQEKRLS
jgi:hypothetical protein